VSSTGQMIYMKRSLTSLLFVVVSILGSGCVRHYLRDYDGEALAPSEVSRIKVLEGAELFLIDDHQYVTGPVFNAGPYFEILPGQHRFTIGFDLVNDGGREERQSINYRSILADMAPGNEYEIGVVEHGKTWQPYIMNLQTGDYVGKVDR